MKTNFDGDDKNISLNGHDKNIRTNKRYTGGDLQIILFLDFGGCCRLYPSWDERTTETGILVRIFCLHWNVLERELYGASRGIKGSKSGLENGLRLLLDVETFDNAFHSWWVAELHGYHLALRKSAGLVIALSENLERPLMGQLGNYVAPGTDTLLAFKVTKSLKTRPSLGYSN